MFNTMITAHSGSDGMPDNSLEFVKMALSLGVDAFEVDVNMGNDGELYLSHDSSPDGKYGSCPTLRDAFELMKSHPSIKINCDLKVHNIETTVLELSEKMGLTGRVIFSGSVGTDFLRENPGIHNKVDIFLNIEEITDIKKHGWPFESPGKVLNIAETAADLCISLGVKVINIHHVFCTDPVVEIIQKKGIKISAWTVNEEKDINRFLMLGVKNITTRKAANALEIRKKFMEGKITAPHGQTSSR